jgi:hypothetical protein
VGEEQKHQKELEDLKTQIKSQFDHMQQLIEDDAEMEVSKHVICFLDQMDYLFILHSFFGVQDLVFTVIDPIHLCHGVTRWRI